LKGEDCCCLLEGARPRIHRRKWAKEESKVKLHKLDDMSCPEGRVEGRKTSDVLDILKKKKKRKR